MPQLENGYIRIATELWEAFCRTRIPGEARQVMDAIIRKTYGFGKKEDTISLSQLSSLTGLKSPIICRAINKLLDMNLIIKKDNKNLTSYGLNKVYSSWKPLTKKITTHKKDNRHYQKSESVLSKKIDTIDNITIDTFTKDKALALLPDNFQTDEFRKKFMEWQDYRTKEKRLSAYKESGAKRVIDKLVRDSGGDPMVAIEIIQNSMENQYQGLFPAKGTNNGTKYI